MTPRRDPVAVIVESRARAMPKSASFAVPSCVTSTLDGLTSRCTIPAACAAARASATWARSAAASSGSRPSACSASTARSAPSTCSITSHCSSCSLTKSKTATTCGWLSLAASLASRWARIRSGEVPSWNCPTRLMATSRPSTWSIGQPDRPHAALADLASQDVAAADRPRWIAHPTHHRDIRAGPPHLPGWVGVLLECPRPESNWRPFA